MTKARDLADFVSAGNPLADGTIDVADINGVTATTAELNILDGVTATTAELNILDGVTSTTSELNILDGVTATTAELNYVDGVTSNVQTQLDAKVALSGGTMTGLLVLSADPTATLGAATKQYVDTQVAGVVDSAPATLDTLNELAAALGDDANFSTTVTNSIATKLSLSGGTMTGDITFNSTQLFDGRDVSADGTKLDGIEASADVTDTANVTAAGALMDSELTSEASVKALDQGVATTDSPTFAGGTFSDAVTVDADGATVLTVDRATSEGPIIDLQKDGSTLGSIGTQAGRVIMYDNNAGFFLDGGSSPSIWPWKATATASGDTDAEVDLGESANRFKNLYLSGNVYASGAFAFDSTDYIGWSNNSYIQVVVNGSARARFESDGDLHADGDVIAYSTTISDPRLKTDIQKIEGALDKLCTLSGYTFTYTPDNTASAGILSTEVAAVLPSAIRPKKLPLKTGDEETVYDTVQYDQLHGLLIEAIKELREEVADLKAKIEG